MTFEKPSIPEPLLALFSIQRTGLIVAYFKTLVKGFWVMV